MQRRIVLMVLLGRVERLERSDLRHDLALERATLVELCNERGNGREKPQRPKEKRVPLKQKISDAEAEIARINGIISKIDVALALPDLFKRDPKQAAQLSKARAGAVVALQRAEEEWLAASSQYEEATG